MGMLYNRLLIILNEESSDSTYYHIALLMLQHCEELNDMSIQELADLCSVSKSTISKFIRFIGYEDLADFKYASIFQENKYHYNTNYVNDVMKYIEQNSMDSFILTLHQDISASYMNLDWSRVNQLAADLADYQNVAAFGLLFSETAALDLQAKLAYNKKFIVTNQNDLKQERYILNAKEDTLIIIFTDSGMYLDRYDQIGDFANKHVFDHTKAKIVAITSNPALKEDPRIAYCICYQKSRSLCTHRIVYGVLTDIIAYQYRTYVKNRQT
ncbi:MAG TPA: MurR/RpiR family transcriptional regulator [Lachnospiraceae bacterium]|nr:MurR/RpiR family transcriptional regulator [Lachnospiraceae bacterium]